MVALNVMGVNLIAPVLPAYAAHFGVGFAIASSLLTSFALARMSLRLVAGRLSDRHGSRRVCAGGGLIQATGALLAGFAPTIGVLLAARLVQGWGSAMFGTSINRYLLVTTEKGELGRATAGFQGGILIGSTIGPLVGGVIAQTLGIFAPFFFQTGVALLLATVSARNIRDDGWGSSAQPAPVGQSIRSVLALDGFKVIMLLGSGLYLIRAGATNVLMPAFADDVLGMSPSQIGAMISLGSVVSLLVMPMAGRLADSIGRPPVALAGAFWAAAAIAMYGLAERGLHIALVAAATGMGVGLLAVALPTMIGDIAPKGTEGLASGVYRIANDMGWVLGPIALGLLADSSRFGLGFIIAGIPLLIGAATLLVSTRRRSLQSSSRP
jgi:MFS family permease